MKSNGFNREKVIEESRKIYKNLSRRLSRVRELEMTPSYALDRFQELQQEYPRKFSEMDDKTLRKFYRDIRYINSLKSSTVKGAIHTSKEWEPIKEKLNSLDGEEQRKLWDIIGQISSDDVLADRIKYESIETAIQLFYSYYDRDKIVEKIKELYFKSAKSDTFLSEEDINVRFTENIDEFFDEYFGNYF